MKTGYNINTHKDFIPANYDLVYINAMFGKVKEIRFNEYWNNTNTLKRGLIHQPALSYDVDEYDNASAFLELLEQLGRSNWDNGNPLIIDIWQAQGEARFNLDHVRVYGQYITNHFRPKVKPLLRINVATWNAYLNTNRTEAIRLLNNYELLLLQPGVTKPSSLTDYGLPAWWESDFGIYKVDETRQWNIDEPVIIPEPTPEPEPGPTEPGPTATVPKKWKISLLGGLISGTIEAVEE